ncbi:MAG: membrane integrity-associated transporter subunit PqiC [Victivallales bacterium]|nr:membrane integrity-associated transporter subunit PqiC [Victivallales bacterium]
MRTETLVVALFLCVAVSACTLLPMQPHIEVHYFDVGDPPFSSPENDDRIDVMSVTSDGPFAEKMVFRTSPVSLAFDEFNRWSTSPAALLKRHLEMVYDRGTELRKAKPLYRLSAKITQWEADLQSSKVNLSIRFDLHKSDSDEMLWSKTFSKNVTVGKITGQSFAESAKEGLDSMLQELDLHIKSATR